MSSYRKAQKSAQKSHRERSQPASRARLGLLEKKKDYRLRAKDYHRKQDALKVLKRKALNKNPDEFYYKMISSQMVDGVHTKRRKASAVTEEQMKMMETQDLRYVNHKLNIESKKIEKLKSGLHMLGGEAEAKPRNKHIFFLHSGKEATDIDLAKRLDTHPALLHRTHNRPTTSMLSDPAMIAAMAGSTGEGPSSSGSFQVLGREKNKQYQELGQRIEREKQLRIIADKMAAKKHSKEKARKELIKEETPESAPVYKFHSQRKR
ncbi:probable U3 small nucleolar RNA-associated protein 11 [Diadema antillarum]|uniref:probable U3 small nucleolar RNA-associated protein 11 n=1 Tax=Diadema antillarum TaxID=105358 RepID=UPI003A859D7C